MKERASGILLHISSLPGPYGIGDFGKAAFEFVDFLKGTGTRYWQILPLGITGFGDSPYQSFSAFAGNPYFIDLEALVTAGYLDEADVSQADLGDDPERVDFGKLYENKMPLLYKAYKNSAELLQEELEAMCEETDWLWDFALFMAIKNHHSSRSWQEWPELYKFRDDETLKEFARANREEIFFWVFTQYFFFKQWSALKEYANRANVRIIGDIPIYVAEDSADVWSKPEMYHLDEDLAPVTVAGCPPDAFTADGQLWGNPIYDWEAMEREDYRWWIKRIQESFMLYDTVRIDHFRGFESYWEIPAEARKAIQGEWTRGPGMSLFHAVEKEMGELDIMAEDLGFLTEEVEKLIEETGFPGMKVLVFAFDSREDSDYLPHNYIRNTVVYTSNHDTQTIAGYLKSAPLTETEFAEDYLKLDRKEGMSRGFVRGAWSSVSYLAVAPMQDLLGLDDTARFNIPSTLGGNNWTWRMKAGLLDQALKNYLARLNRTYRR